MATDAVFLNDVLSFFFRAQWFGDKVEREHGHMDGTVPGFDEVFWNKCMGSMAIHASRPDLMASVIPTLIGGVHHVAIVTSRGIVAEIGCEISSEHADSQNSNKANQTDDDGDLQLTLSQIILINYTSGVVAIRYFGY